VILNTEKLILRQWHVDDYQPFAKLNANSEVMAFYPNKLTTFESDRFAQKLESLIKKRGWGLWAGECKVDSQFIGYIGLHDTEATLPFYPRIEIGWRLSRAYWGNGYATEGAKAAMQFAFEVLLLDEVISFTSVKNSRSQAVMRRLGMMNTGENFEHPAIPEGHPLREHVYYKMIRSDWFFNRD